MHDYATAGAMLKAYRKQAKLSQKAFTAKTQLVDEAEKGIPESILSQIEHGKRPLTARYLKLIDASEVFSAKQIEQLANQAIKDMIRRRFGRFCSRHEENCTLTTQED